MARVVRSPLAKRDIVDVIAFTKRRWGPEQAREYGALINEALNALANDAMHESSALAERLEDANGVVHYHRPDCLFLLRPATGDARSVVAAFLEADRNTEAMRRIRGKLAAYFLYWSQRRFREVFGAAAMRVLFVLDDVVDRRRVHSMQEELRQFATENNAEPFRRCFRFARKRDLDATTVISKPIWWDADDKPRLFFQPTANGQQSADPRAEVVS